MKPLSFSEFLEASGNQQLKQALANVELSVPIDETAHQKAMGLLRLYLVLGGMPAVLKNYIADKDILNCQKIQTALLQTYRSDFGKYAKISQHKYLQKIFDSTPRLVGQRIKYTLIDPEEKSRDLKNAVDLLDLAGVVKPIYLSSASGLPIGSKINEKKFKLLFLDVGLAQNSCGLQSNLLFEENIMQINAGGVAEQFVGQELLAYDEKNRAGDLFFWARDKRGSRAEVDYLINIGSDIFPVEVKAGKQGGLKSLRLFVEEKKSRFGVRISLDKLSYVDQVLSLPLYLIEQLPRLVQSVVSGVKKY
ncbi:hypothetical protein A2291_04750 [candidate division WOR-1 bacterium RIFOXYB2_FULL_42_35]|nr:MAG: hypothetical protein A2247_02895 [candidate division WOR-1 bacterium RIFOXYA2_FULL_41_14]OGC25319.1 MAG: hypothetical protein A2291_04750 [candidate division WOR-1 bacterium RIFOXYB2_FULL_42_35]